MNSVRETIECEISKSPCLTLPLFSFLLLPQVPNNKLRLLYLYDVYLTVLSVFPIQILMIKHWLAEHS